MNALDSVADDPKDAAHIAVLAHEVIVGLNIRPGIRMIDGTLGGGGHTAQMLERSAPDGTVLGVDADPAALRRVQAKFPDEIAQGRLVVAAGNFVELEQIAQAHGFANVDAILLDLGVSSFQLETAERGFSFMQDGPLDMRFDPTQALDAAEIVNTWQEQELANLLYEYGEETRSRRIARYLVQHRPFTTTGPLAQAVEKAVGGRKGSRIHPATRTFQALRIAVNEELTHLEQVLPQCLNLLKPAGRLAVISFHSLEDRIVKQWMQREARTYVHDPLHPFGGQKREPTLTIITPKPLTATVDEANQNPRSRSAKLRIAERPHLIDADNYTKNNE
ncbi:MAG: 16S rRNA (cytosine(1402)-N(4))-methyltransferase RsmH [Chloroflexi bacterium]|nr:16S rRNA (cytosine(1402)-N(4))-methyltransferase RsmH [Chloroflexota bacterium]